MYIHATIKLLDWENQFFGRHSALLSFDSGSRLEPEQLHEFDVVQAKVLSQRLSELDKLSQLGFRLVEGEIDLRLDIAATAYQPGIRIARPAHIPQLRAAAGQLFTHSRFRMPWYCPQASARFYAQWIENAVLGAFDDQCLLAVDGQDQLQGFVSLRQLGDKSARIGLLATLPIAQRQGVGRRLINAAAHWCKVRQLTHLHVATQLSNLAAIRFYLHCGARSEQIAYWLYR